MLQIQYYIIIQLIKLNAMKKLNWNLLVVFAFCVCSLIQAQALKRINWSTMTGVSYDIVNETLTKTASTGWNNAGAYSTTIATMESGEVFFQTDGINTGYVLGFAANQSGFDLQDVKFGIWIDRFEFHLVQNNQYIGSFGLHKANDIFQIKRLFNTISFEHNGNVIFQTGCDPYEPLSAQTIIFDQGGTVSEPLISWNDVVDEPFSPICSSADNLNYSSTKLYDEEGVLIANSISYVDKLGKEVQSQVKNLTLNEVLASQSIYDAYGRPVVQTLSAPTNSSNPCYKSDFVQNVSGGTYDYTDFDLPNTTGSPVSGEIDNPKLVGEANIGTLGWYYSDNNSLETHVSDENYPYSRIEYSKSNPGQVRRSSMAGNTLRMGRGHESESYTLPASGELYDVFGYMGDWTLSNQDLTEAINNAPAPLALKADYNVYKKIVIDPNEGEYVSFLDYDEQVIATCRSGLSSNPEFHQYVSSLVPFGGHVDIHLPNHCETSLLIHTYSNCDAKFKIRDLRTDEYINGGALFSEGANPTTLEAGFYRIIHVSESSTGNYPAGGVALSYRLNYERWSINYFDLNRRITRTVPPLGVDTVYSASPTVSSNSSTEVFSGILPSNGNALQGNDDVSVSITNNANSNLALAYINLTAIVPPSTACVTGSVFGNTFQYVDPVSLAINIASEREQFTSEKRFTDENRNSLVVPGAIHKNRMKAEDRLSKIKQVFAEQPALYSSSSFQIAHIPGNNIGGSIQQLSLPSNITCPYDEYVIDYVFEKNIGATQMSIFPSHQMKIRHYIQDGCDCNESWVVEYGQSSFSYFNTHIDEDAASVTEYKARVININASYRNSSGSIGPLTDFSGLSDVSLKLEVNYAFSTETPQHIMASDYEYNSLNWLLKTISPDEGTSEFNYRKDGQIRFSQNEVQRNASGTYQPFSYTNYDRFGRPIESGVYIANNELGIEFEKQYSSPSINNTIGIVDNIDPSVQYGLIDANGSKSERSYIYYDLADDINLATETGLIGWNQTYVNGAVSYTKNDNMKTWYSYDHQGRLIWMIQQVMPDDLPSGPSKTLEYAYNASGSVEKITYQKGMADAYIHFYTYDADGNLSKVYADDYINSNVPVYQLNESKRGKYEYYTHGALKRLELGDDIQGIDYVYTINGWLKSINNPASYNNASQDPGGDVDDLFAMTLDYFSGDFNRTGVEMEIVRDDQTGGALDPVSRYDGTIRAQHFEHPNTNKFGADEQAVVYHYDDFNYLTNALYGQFTASPTLPNLSYLEKFKLTDVKYDLNGNLISLNRNGSSAPYEMDILKYEYESVNGNRINNQLGYVIDQGTGSPDINDIENQTPDNYIYNSMGQLIQDNEGSPQHYHYNTQGLVIGMSDNGNLSSGPLVKFYYDDKGFRLKKVDYDNTSHAQLNTTLYIRDNAGKIMTIYDQSSPTTSDIIERPFFGNGRLGLKKGADYLYEIKDHLGNVRSVMNDLGVEYVNTDYYPFGMRMQDMNSSAENYRFGYQGEFAEEDKETGKHQFQLRLYDSRLGRWSTIDPANQYHSPYLGMGNNPISGVDPDGAKNVFHDKFGNVTSVTFDYWWHNALFGTVNHVPNIFGTNSVLTGDDFSNWLLAPSEYLDPVLWEEYDATHKKAMYFSKQGKFGWRNYDMSMSFEKSQGNFIKHMAAAMMLNVIKYLPVSKEVAKTSTTVLEGAALRNFIRFLKKMPANSKSSATFEKLRDGNYLFQATSPGKVPGSRALYQKWVNSQGETYKMLKTTFGPDGKIIHVKPK